MKKDLGQVVILLLLIMVVALAIGLSTIGRSILEVSTSRKSEDSSRAFSAAEAAIEKAMKANENNIGGTTIIQVNPLTLSNKAGATVQGYSVPTGNNALGFYKITKRDFAQFWLANPNDISVASYNQSSFYIYFGDPDTAKYFTSDDPEDLKQQPAIEVNVIYWDNINKKYDVFRKHYDAKKANANDTSTTSTTVRSEFDPSCDYTNTTATVDSSEGGPLNLTYYCRVNVTGYPHTADSFPIMVRVRMLYSDLPHNIALQPIGASLPKQANLYNSSGTSGDVKRTLEVNAYRDVMPQLFDYVLFSAKDLIKDTVY